MGLIPFPGFSPLINFKLSHLKHNYCPKVIEKLKGFFEKYFGVV